MMIYVENPDEYTKTNKLLDLILSPDTKSIEDNSFLYNKIWLLKFKKEPYILIIR